MKILVDDKLAETIDNRISNWKHFVYLVRSTANYKIKLTKKAIHFITNVKQAGTADSSFNKVVFGYIDQHDSLSHIIN